MKKLFLLFAVLILNNGLKSQNIPNPYASIGKKAPKMATLTQGSYDEFFIKDSLVLINGDAISRKTGELVYAIETNPKEIKDLKKEQDERFRFLSTDPLTKEYPFYTPYQFAGNDVIANIDLDGLEPASTIYQKDGVMPKIHQLSSSTILYQPSHTAIIDHGALVFHSEYETSITGTMAREKTARSVSAANEFELNKMRGGQTGALTPVYPELLFLGGPAIKTGSKVLDLAYEVTIGSMGKPVNLGTSLVLYDAKFAVKQGLSNGIYDFDKVKAMIPDGTPNSFIPSSTINQGEKYLFEAGGSKVELKWHSPDANAASKFPGSNAGTVNTAQIKVDNKLLNTNGGFQKKPSNETHIPKK